MDEARRLLKPGLQLHTLDLLLLECSNVLCKHVRRDKLDIGIARRVSDALTAFPFRLERAEDYRAAALEYSLETGASLYDAVFLAQAGRVGEPLVTADRRFYNNISDSQLSIPIVWVGDL